MLHQTKEQKMVKCYRTMKHAGTMKGTTTKCQYT